MSAKHIKDYYKSVTNQYMEMLNNLKELETEYADSAQSPEVIENLRNMIMPITNQYKNLSYIVYLLNMPTRKEKQKKYERQNKKLLAKMEDKYKKENVIDENEKILKQMKSNKK